MRSRAIFSLLVAAVLLCMAACGGPPAAPQDTPAPDAPTPVLTPTPTPTYDHMTIPEPTPLPPLSTVPPAGEDRLSAQFDSRYWYSGLDSGGLNCLAVMQDGTLWAWGERGPGAYDPEPRPASVPVEDSDEWATLSDLGVGPVRWVKCGDFFAGLFIDRENALWLWHPGSYFDLSGEGLWGSRDDSGPEKFMDDVAMAWLIGGSLPRSGDYGCLALRTDGSLWTWGRSENGRLGLGRETTDLIVHEAGESYNAPQMVMEGVAYACSDRFGCYAIDEAGDLWGWGDIGISDEAGDLCRYEPTYILSDVVYVRDFLAVKSDGSLWTWGVYDVTDRPETTVMPGDGQPRKLLENVCMADLGIWGDYCLVFRENGEIQLLACVPAEVSASGMWELESEPVWTTRDVYWAGWGGEELLLVKTNCELWEVPYQRGDVLNVERIEETMHKVLDGLWIPNAS